jgi:ABC-type Zn uptake system ZnuABC Zn-binding protein ZnuA
MTRPSRRLSLGLLFALAVCCALTGGCPRRARVEKPRVAVSIFPLYDVARRVAGERLDVVLVLPPGRSEHSFDPTPREMARVADARLGLAVGLEMDSWLERLVRGAAGSNVTLVQVGPRVGPRAMHSEEIGEEAADEARDGGEEEHHHGPTDPHFWLDPLKMQSAVDVMVESFSALDPVGANGFRVRGDALKRALGELHTRVEQRSRTWTHRTMVTFHGSMGYYAERYGLTIAAVIEPFPGREPTARYVTEVLAAIRTTGTVALFSEPQLERRPAEVIAEQAHVRLFELDPIGGTSGRDTYEKLIEYNTDVIDRALR